jgi:glycosyltransferase involved in cell wall biosynthesis
VPFLAATSRLPRAAAIVAFGGTDVPGPEAGPQPPLSHHAQAALQRADRIVLRHAGHALALPPTLVARGRAIGPSATAVGPRPALHERQPEVVALAHLRAVKDPFTLVAAMRRLPTHSRLVAVHLGAALDDASRREAEHLSAQEARWRWLGPVPRRLARERLRHAQALVLTSRSEGAPGALIEAVVQGVPPLCSDIAAVRALLGENWPARFPVGDDAALARLLQRLEQDPAWVADLEARLTALAPRFAPTRERADWRALFVELGLTVRG